MVPDPIVKRTRPSIIILLVLVGAVVVLGVFLFSGGEDTTAAPSTTSPSSSSTDLPGTTSASDATDTPTTSRVPLVANVPEFDQSTCRFEVPEGTSPRCGWLTVPEDRTVENGREVRLHVAIFEADDPVGAPIVYLAGGPGGEALATLEFSFETSWAPLLEHGDLIFFDQRGVGWSQPSLACPEELELSYDLLDEQLDPDEMLAEELGALSECRQRLVDDGIDLAAYDSASNAADVADLRVALDIDEWNLLGISYGTRLAQTVVRDHPEGVRSVILDSTYPIDANLMIETPRNLDRALDTLFAACATDPACAEMYPDLEERVYALADRLDAEPLSLQIRDFISGERYDSYLDGPSLIGTMFQALYSEILVPQLPEMISELESGETGIAQLLNSNTLTQASFFSFGMHLSVQCREEIPFTEPADIAAGLEDYPELRETFAYSFNVSEAMFDLCSLWDVGEAGAVENTAVSSDIPTLVLAGGFDPITPPRWGREVAAGFPASHFVEFPTLGHGISIAGECPAGVTLQFLAEPRSMPDTSCIATMEPPEFVTAPIDPASIILELFEEDFFGVTISGVFPSGWEQVQPGTWVRDPDGIDQTMLLQQAVPSFGLDAERLLELLAEQFWIEDGLRRDRTVQADAGDWDVYTGVIDGYVIDAAVRDTDGVLGVVLLVSDDDDRGVLLRAVLEPALQEFRSS